MPHLHAHGSQLPRHAEDGPIDVMEVYARLAEEAVRRDQRLMTRLNAEGAQWRAIMACIAGVLNGKVEDPGELAYNLVVPTLTRILGPKNVGWKDFRQDGRVYAVAVKK